MNSAYLLIGGNIGNRLDNLVKAGDLIEAVCGSILQQSSVYETAAWGNTNQPSFFNQALHIHSFHSPEELIARTLNIELEMGRERNEMMGPRTIDIDILFYNQIVLETKLITIPHPRLHLRNFVLIPLNEIAAGYVHPVFKKTIQELLNECPDPLDVHKISSTN
ncbi:MAG: folK [Chitinophagaceae bacterium]|nr:folK [Chitinophagaceae bacterium]